MVKSRPLVSVLMPTYKHEEFIDRAIRSLLAQSYTNWELIVFDDGSPDRTRQRVENYRRHSNIRYVRGETNIGLGAALNAATALARGDYVAYLPSDDVYFADHLERLVEVLVGDADVYLAYGGVQVGMGSYGAPETFSSATLQGDAAVGREMEVLANRKGVPWTTTLKSGNILALVQVMHRRDHEAASPWTPREERVSDDIEAAHWRWLLSLGCRFRYAGSVTCQWGQHPRQRHKIIGGVPDGRGFIVGGPAMYRTHYRIPPGQYLNWQPVQGYAIDEWRRWGALERKPRRDEPHEGLRILLVGDLGFNPERILVLEDAGHELAGLWTPEPEVWMGTGPFPFGRIRDIPADGDWRSAVSSFAPDIIYAGLNWQSLRIAAQVMDAGLDVPFVLHFKESPNAALDHGLWPVLVRLMRSSAGRIFINEETRRWFEEALGPEVASNALVLDGDLPLARWFTDDFEAKLSARTGEIHTVCSGRWKGLDRWEEFAEAGVHVHIYGEMFQQPPGDVVSRGARSGIVHLHPAVEPKDWVRELSRYDAGWLHVFESGRSDDIRSATWSDLNLPARLPTYASAGLPWIFYDNEPAGTAVERLAARLGVGVPFRTVAGLGRALSDEGRLRQLSNNMLAHRHEFTFESHVDDLVRYFRKTISAYRGTRGAATGVVSD